MGVLIIALAGVAFVHLRGLPGGFLLVLWLVLCVVATDIGGYFVGRSVGGPKLWPAVSPKKTWSGALGSLTAALVTAGIFALFTNGSLPAFLSFGVVISVTALAGDLLESHAKRSFGIKDSGGVLPGHGGLLDRFDGLAAVLVLFLILSLLTDLGSLLGSGYTPPG